MVRLLVTIQLQRQEDVLQVLLQEVLMLEALLILEELLQPVLTQEQLQQEVLSQLLPSIPLALHPNHNLCILHLTEIRQLVVV